MRAAKLIVPAALAVALVPGVAAADPQVPEANLRESVKDLKTAESITDLDLAKSVLPLEEEKGADGKVTVRIASDVLFDFGEASLTKPARTRIGQIAERLRGTSDPVRVVGFTDNKGSPAANLRLSKRRAKAVKAELLERLKSGVKIRATGRGEASPVASNTLGGKDNPSGRARNRRVEITFTKS